MNIVTATTLDQWKAYDAMRPIPGDPTYENLIDDTRQLVTEETDWFLQAACKGLYRERDAIFFPPENIRESKSEKEMRESRAKEICGRCAVRAQCLDYAIEQRDQHGIWGGATEKERVRIRNKRLHG